MSKSSIPMHPAIHQKLLFHHDCSPFTDDKLPAIKIITSKMRKFV